MGMLMVSKDTDPLWRGSTTEFTLDVSQKVRQVESAALDSVLRWIIETQVAECDTLKPPESESRFWLELQEATKHPKWEG